VLLISSDLDEIIELSHRIVVMFRGKIVGEFKTGEVNLDQLGLMMAGHVNH
jgi:simple sugar transport system ATP-binding protein